MIDVFTCLNKKTGEEKMLEFIRRKIGKTVVRTGLTICAVFAMLFAMTGCGDESSDGSIPAKFLDIGFDLHEDEYGRFDEKDTTIIIRGLIRDAKSKEGNEKIRKNIISYLEKNNGRFVIPQKIKGTKVTEVSFSPADEMTNEIIFNTPIKELVIPEGVERVYLGKDDKWNGVNYDEHRSESLIDKLTKPVSCKLTLRTYIGELNIIDDINAKPMCLAGDMERYARREYFAKDLLFTGNYYLETLDFEYIKSKLILPKCLKWINLAYIAEINSEYGRKTKEPLQVNCAPETEFYFMAGLHVSSYKQYFYAPCVSGGDTEVFLFSKTKSTTPEDVLSSIECICRRCDDLSRWDERYRDYDRQVDKVKKDYCVVINGKKHSFDTIKEKRHWSWRYDPKVCTFLFYKDNETFIKLVNDLDIGIQVNEDKK